MATPVWSVPNNTNLGLITEFSSYEIALPLNVSGLTSTVISGQLPPGLRLENNVILGTPLEVHTETVFSFVIRAQSSTIISDRSLSLRVTQLEIWNIADNQILATIEGPNAVEIPLPVSKPDSTTTTLITPLPAGLTLTNNTIVGTTIEVDHVTNVSFIVRATNNNISADRNLILKLKNLVWSVIDNYDINTIPENHSYTLPLFPTILNNSSFTTTIIDGSLPDGLSLSNNIISGTPFPVTVDTVSTFTIRASHVDGITSDKTFTLTVAITPWTIQTGYDINKHDFANLPRSERDEFTFPLPLAYSSNTETSVISGMLPPGLVLIDNVLQGKPFEVVDTTTFTFVIRAVLKEVVSDKTFYLTVEGADIPQWITDPGKLPFGVNQRYYVRDETYVDFQLIAVDPDTIAGQELTFWIASNDGQLPPDLVLSSSGRIYGWVQPILNQNLPGVSGFYDSTPYDAIIYDRGTLNSFGFDSYGYDIVNYDFKDFFARPRKLNRNYEFTVSISDGNTVVKRTFSMLVVGDSTALTDEVISEDLTSIREPIWITDSNLGTKRANNYQTIRLDIYETIDKAPVFYFLEELNPDGSPSLLPPGLEFDTSTSEVFGVIPFQPAVTKYYNFTVTAIRIGPLKANPTSSEEQYPLKVNDDIVYRSYDVELSTGYNRVYQTTGYNNSLGVRIYRVTSTSSWIYQNNNFDFIHYSNINIPFVWDAAVWYADSSLITTVIGPMITVLPTGPTVYTDYYESASSSRTFSIKVIGEIDRNIKWISPAELGIIEAEQSSTLQVHAETSDNSVVNYSLVSGQLPPGLTLNSDGEISGKVTQFNSYRFIGEVKGGDQTNPTDLRGLIRYVRVTGRVNDGINEFPNNTLPSVNGTYIWRGDGTLYPIIYVSDPAVIGGLDMMNPTNISSGFLEGEYYIIAGDGWFYYGTRPFPTLPFVGVTNPLDPGYLLPEDFEYFTTHTFYATTDQALYWNNGPHKIFFVDLVGTENTLLEALDVSNKPGKLPGDFHTVTTSGWFYDGINVFHANTDYSIVLTALDQVTKVKTSEITSRLTVFDFTIDGGTTTIDRVFGFDVFASDEAQSRQIIQTFYIKVITPNTKKFSDMIVQPMMELPQREAFKNFITDMEIFESKLLYRPGDPSFGIQDNLSMIVYAGIETTDTSRVIEAVGQNHSRKRFKFGEIKTAQAKIPGTHTIVYEVIYLEMQDPLQVGKISLPLSIETAPENTPITIDGNSLTLDGNANHVVDPYQTLKLPSTITNWRMRINDIGLHDRHYLPLWMRTIQDGSMVELDYVPAVTLCYCKPGQSATIILNIKNYMKSTGFNFNQFDYDIDRYIISSVSEYSNNKYIMFPTTDLSTTGF